MITDINSEDRLVQATFAEHLRDKLGWESVYAYNTETFGSQGTLGRASEREVVLLRDLRAALARLNPDLPESAREQAVEKLTRIDHARSLLQHNREYYRFICDGVPVDWRDPSGETRYAHARVIDFRNVNHNCFLAVRERACVCRTTTDAPTSSASSAVCRWFSSNSRRCTRTSARVSTRT